eukprot:scaffold60102_cov53-Attheya_sp.AAC.3
MTYANRCSIVAQSEDVIQRRQALLLLLNTTKYGDSLYCTYLLGFVRRETYVEQQPISVQYSTAASCSTLDYDTPRPTNLLLLRTLLRSYVTTFT